MAQSTRLRPTGLLYRLAGATIRMTMRSGYLRRWGMDFIRRPGSRRIIHHHRLDPWGGTLTMVVSFGVSIVVANYLGVVAFGQL